MRGVVEMAHCLDMTVFADSVETTTQAELLSTLRCNFSQGDYFSPPVNAEQATALLTSLANGRTHEKRPTLKLSIQAVRER